MNRASQLRWIPLWACYLGLAAQLSGQAPKLEVLPPLFYQFDGGPPIRGEVTYLAGETIFVSALVSGFSVSGKDTVALDWKAEAFDDKGIPLVKGESKTVEEELAPEDKDWKPKLVWQFETPQTALCTKCRFVLRVQDKQNGAVSTREAFFQIKGRAVEPSESLVIRNFRFLRAEEDGAGLQTPSYRPGDELWARFEITGFRYGEGNQIGVDYGLTVYRPSGKVLFEEPKAASNNEKAFYPRRYVEGVLNLRLQALPLGDYPITVEVRDSVGNQKFESKFTFRVE